MSPERITINDLPDCSGLNEASTLNYFRAKYSLNPLMKNRVINSFEELLEKETGFNAENLPPQLTTTTQTYGEITFTVESEKRKKRPQLETVYEGVKNYLEFLEEGYNQRIQRKGVKTFEGKGYVLLEEILTKISELKQEVSIPEVTHSHSNNFAKEYDGTSVVVPISYPITLNESGALLYVRAQLLSGKLEEKVVKPFENLLKEQTGYDAKHIPSQMEIYWTQIGSHLFEVRTIPESTVRYAEIITGLTKPAPKKIREDSKIGDLIRINEGLPLDSEIVAQYMPRTDEGRAYIRIEGTLNRLKQLKEQSTHETLNQPIRYYPVV
ncbi:hypothetical protein HZC32_03095 [Candidatus Woesearchaeota archaeon]|nr:hypothetical protein [Candidatus Woesearchaeota archaeon]